MAQLTRTWIPIKLAAATFETKINGNNNGNKVLLHFASNKIQ